jgi:hypothetical protein
VVGDVSQSALSPPTLPQASEKPQHLVSLLSVEDDALGEELQVIWEIEPEAVATWLRDDPEFIAGLNRARAYRLKRLRAEVRSLASDALATLRELVSSPGIPSAVRLKASLAILQAADAFSVETIGTTSARGAQAVLDRKALLESLG